ncbi:MAG TPA: hypothetical protein VNO87_09125 [Methylomirabilota bacterium]|nr:hypothetical protein [Methylomirabilota bacterium]
MNGNSPKPVLERHDLGVPGREVVQVRVDFDSGTAFGKHTPTWIRSLETIPG